MGYAAAEAFPKEWLRPRFIRDLLDLKIGGTEIWMLIQNKFGMEYQAIVDMVRRNLLVWTPLVLGLLVAVTSLIIAWLITRRRGSTKSKQHFGFSAWSWSLLICVAVFLSPTRILGAGYTSYDCSGDVLSSYEMAGKTLAQYVRPGGLVYWSGGDSAAPLLYIPDAEIFPPQLNDGYTFRIGGDSEVIHRLSYWDETLRTEWLKDADYLLIEDRFYDDFWVNTGDWVQLAETPPVDSCREGASIHILVRVSQ